MAYDRSSSLDSLPSDLEAERAILGSIINQNLLLDEALSLGCQGKFFLESHRRIFAAMIKLKEEGHPITEISLHGVLIDAGELEQAGGAAFLSSLDIGIPKTDSIAYYIKRLRQKNIQRQIIKAGMYLSSMDFSVSDPGAVIDDSISKFESMLDEMNKWESSPLIYPFNDFITKDFGPQELIGFEVRRRELCLIAAVTNRGKSTLIRNALLALATGSEFLPLVIAAESRRVLLLDFESSMGRLQSDLAVMTRSWPEEKLERLRENFFVLCEPRQGDDMLSLSHHMKIIEREAKKHKLDLIAVDTASAAFDLFNENDNGEVARKALKPLLQLARSLDCAVVLAHHKGKMSQDESRTSEKAYSARGASAWGCYPTSVFAVEASTAGKDRITLTCAKRKDGPEYERSMVLDQEKRWFSAGQDTPQIKPPTTKELIRSAITKTMSKSEIIDALKSKGFSVRTIENCIREDVKAGFITKINRGIYAPAQTTTYASSI